MLQLHTRSGGFSQPADRTCEPSATSKRPQSCLHQHACQHHTSGWLCHLPNSLSSKGASIFTFCRLGATHDWTTDFVTDVPDDLLRGGDKVRYTHPPLQPGSRRKSTSADGASLTMLLAFMQ